MQNLSTIFVFRRAVLIAVYLTFSAASAANAQQSNIKSLTGKAAMNDWTSDTPGVRRKITIEDLPAPGSNLLAINPPHVVGRPASAQLQVPPDFKIDLYASGFGDPRFLLTAPNGDIFVSESRANQIKVLRDLTKPFGIAFLLQSSSPC